MDFTWDNKSGPLDPTSPFYKFATMKSMSSCKTIRLNETYQLIRQDHTAPSTHQRGAAFRACANPTLNPSSSLNRPHRPSILHLHLTELRHLPLHANPSMSTSLPARRTFPPPNKQTTKIHRKRPSLPQNSQVWMRSLRRSATRYSISTAGLHRALAGEIQHARNSVTRSREEYTRRGGERRTWRNIWQSLVGLAKIQAMTTSRNPPVQTNHHRNRWADWLACSALSSNTPMLQH